jgi:hypothetical protein
MSWRVKLHRKIEDREWYKDVNAFRLFFHLILKANHKDWRWRWIEVKRGQLITWLFSLSEQLGLTPQQIRTAIDKLISTWEISKKATNKFTIITVLKYDDYNSLDLEDNKQITNEQQTNNKQITTNKNDKNNKRNDQEKNLKEWKEGIVQIYERCWFAPLDSLAYEHKLKLLGERAVLEGYFIQGDWGLQQVGTDDGGHPIYSTVQSKLPDWKKIQLKVLDFEVRLPKAKREVKDFWSTMYKFLSPSKFV